MISNFSIVPQPANQFECFIFSLMAFIANISSTIFAFDDDDDDDEEEDDDDDDDEPTQPWPSDWDGRP